MKKVLGGILVVLLATWGALYWTHAMPLTNAKSKLPSFGGVSLTLDYALTEADREKGLGGRTSLPENYGMLFVFAKDDYWGFWMKDTLVPLDMFWLNDQGQVVSIAQNVATSSFPTVFYPSQPARYVLETAAGFAKLHRIATGTPLLLQSLPTVSE